MELISQQERLFSVISKEQIDINPQLWLIHS
jgi:hypothetical protein